MLNNERKKKIQNTFNEVAKYYDNQPLRFFIKSAKHLVSVMPIKGTELILDIGTGTGNAAIEIAKSFPNTKIIGIDFSEGMLACAREKALNAHIKNIDFIKMDMQEMKFQDNFFDVMNCSFGIFFLEDMVEFLRTITAKLKNQGTLIITTFHKGTFSPLVELFYDRIQKYGVNNTAPTWEKISTEEKLTELLQTAGLHNIRIVREKIGYHLNNADTWWEIICGAAMKGLVNQIPCDKRDEFKKEHLNDIQQHLTQQGIWLEVEVMHAFCIK
jgi:ubiquinone/menaquinone biosynthesis C-methylase UbiE